MKRIIGMVQSKGGVGKSTTALNLGAEMVRRGRKVVLFDADPAGHSAAIAADGRLAFDVLPHLLEEVDDATVSAWAKVIREQGADFVIIDAPGAMGGAFGATIAISDLVLVPSGPTASGRARRRRDDRHDPPAPEGLEAHQARHHGGAEPHRSPDVVGP